MIRIILTAALTLSAFPALAQEDLTAEDSQFVEQLDTSAQQMEQAVRDDVQSVDPNITVTGPTHIESVTKEDGKIIIEYGLDE